MDRIPTQPSSRGPDHLNTESKNSRNCPPAKSAPPVWGGVSTKWRPLPWCLRGVLPPWHGGYFSLCTLPTQGGQPSRSSSPPPPPQGGALLAGPSLVFGRRLLHCPAPPRRPLRVHRHVVVIAGSPPAAGPSFIQPRRRPSCSSVTACSSRRRADRTTTGCEHLSFVVGNGLWSVLQRPAPSHSTLCRQRWGPWG